MANICCDDVYFHSQSNPEHLAALWEDLETSIIFCHNEDLAGIGNLFEMKLPGAEPSSILRDYGTFVP